MIKTCKGCSRRYRVISGGGQRYCYSGCREDCLKKKNDAKRLGRKVACKQCGCEFVPPRRNKKYCSNECHEAYLLREFKCIRHGFISRKDVRIYARTGRKGDKGCVIACLICEAERRERRKFSGFQEAII